MPPRKKAKAAADPVGPVFDISQYRDTARYYIWREIERDDQEPLRIKVQDLTIRQANDLAFPATALLGDIYVAIAPYVVEWNLRAENLETGEIVDVPPPVTLGPEAFELLPTSVSTNIYFWLRSPWLMHAATEKKASTPSTSTTEPPSTSD